VGGYGALLSNWVIILTNAVILSMSLTMIILKIRYSGKEDEKLSF